MRTRISLAIVAILPALLLTGCTQFGEAPLVTATVPPSAPVSTITPTPATPEASTSAKPTSDPTITLVPAAGPSATPTPSTATPKPVPTSNVSAAKAKAQSQLKTIKVAEADYSVKYSRTKDFGPAWYDEDHNGCDTRNDILRKQLTNITYRSDDPGCTVATGTLKDDYTGTTIHFVRGVSTSSKIEIDHIVPLHYIWMHGADKWAFAEREAYANDQKNVLLAVDGQANEQKGDSGPADWMPSNASYRCTYVEKFTNILSVYKATVSRRDYAAINSVLATCK